MVRKVFMLIFLFVVITSCNKSNDSKPEHTTIKDSSTIDIVDIFDSTNVESENNIIIDSIHPDSLKFDDSISMERRAIKLEDLFLKIRSSSSNSKDRSLQIRFFRTFPDDFETYMGIYGWFDQNDPKTVGIFYDLKYYPQLKYFFSLDKTIPINLYWDKLIRLAIDGHWDPDAASDLQRKIRLTSVEHTSVFEKRLRKFTQQDWLGFWKFYFEEPHPVKEIPNHLKIIEEVNPEMYSVMLEALQKVQRLSEH